MPRVLKDGEPVDLRSLSKLQWRCRRGLLENDLFVDRFFKRHGAQLTHGQARGLGQLMELADNDLLDLLLRRRDPSPDSLTIEARYVLELMRGAKDGACTAVAT